MLTQLQEAIPDVFTGEDGTIYILFSVQAGQFENVFLANQLLLNDIFIQTASLQALRLHGAQFGLSLKEGNRAVGTLKFSGAGGTYIPLLTEAAYDPGAGLDPVYFRTTVDGTLPNPGIPPALVMIDNGATGSGLGAGTYEYAVSFVTAEGETAMGAPSNALTIVAGHQIAAASVPVGGPGTVGRNLWRRFNGTTWYRVFFWGNNDPTGATDNGLVAIGGTPLDESTAESLSLAAEAVDTGLEGNVAVGTVTALTSAPAAITDVVNPTAFLGGTDQEDVEVFRTRLLEHVSNPQTGSVGDIKSWAEEISGVESATVFPNDNLGTPANGHVTVRISGPGGAQPPQSVLDAVLTELVGRDIANITFHVASFTSVVSDVTVDVTTESTYTLADVTTAVQLAISDYINSLPVGATLYISGIIAAVKPLAGIADVTVTTPATNQTTGVASKRVPGTITVS